MRFILSIIAIVTFFVTPLSVSAAPNINQYTGTIATGAGYDPGDASDTAFSARVGQIIKIALGLVGMIFFALTVYAGYLWMTAAGNDDQVSKATDIIKMAVMGLIITLAAYSITYFIVGRIGASTNTNSAADLNATTTEP